MIIADVTLTGYDLAGIAHTFQSVPAAALLIAAFGALCGYGLAACVDKLPAAWGITLGIGVAILLMGFNDPDLGVQQPYPNCTGIINNAGQCVPFNRPFTLTQPSQ